MIRQRWMKWGLGALLTVGAALAGWQLPVLWDQNAETGAVVRAQTVSEPAVNSGRIVVDGRLVPVVQADLSLPRGGVVAQIAIAEGERVEAGQLLVKLDDAEQRTAVSRAEAELRRAQARLAEVTAGARTQEIEAAEAALAAGQARLERIAQGALPGETAAARANVAAAQAALQRTLEGASEQALIAARADLANAEAALSRAQSAYDLVRWRNDVGALPESANLQTATNNVEAARARLADLEAGPSAAAVAQARAEVSRAQAQLDQLASVLPADVQAAEADVRQLQAQLDLVRAGARPEQVAVAEADVAAATAVLQQALVALADTELRAPFAGTVALLEVNPGEQVQPGALIVRLADLGRWEVRTEDLTELQVANVRVGERLSVGFDALPDLELAGLVQRIRPIGTDQRGDIVYTVVVSLQENDPRLLWNMTAVVSFE